MVTEDDKPITNVTGTKRNYNEMENKGKEVKDNWIFRIIRKRRKVKIELITRREAIEGVTGPN